MRSRANVADMRRCSCARRAAAICASIAPFSLPAPAPVPPSRSAAGASSRPAPPARSLFCRAVSTVGFARSICCCSAWYRSPVLGSLPACAGRSGMVRIGIRRLSRFVGAARATASASQESARQQNVCFTRAASASELSRSWPGFRPASPRKRALRGFPVRIQPIGPGDAGRQVHVHDGFIADVLQMLHQRAQRIAVRDDEHALAALELRHDGTRSNRAAPAPAHP